MKKTFLAYAAFACAAISCTAGERGIFGLDRKSVV